MRIIGIDPGLTGAMCVLDLADDNVIGYRFYDTPTLTIESKTAKTKSGARKTFTVVDGKKLSNILREEIGNARAVIEKVSAAPIAVKGRQNFEPCPTCHRIPQPGATSSFNFGTGYGLWLGVLYGLQIPFVAVHPATWKRQFMELVSKEQRELLGPKQSSIIAAKQVYPACAACLSRVKDHGRADALLLAEYGRLNRHGPPTNLRADSSKQMTLEDAEF